MRSKGIVARTAAGIAAGLAASWIMNAFQDRLRVLEADGGSGGADEPSTVKAADAVSEAATGEPVPPGSRRAAGTAVHYAFGALLGGAYGGLSERYPAIRAGGGTAFGAGVSLAADEGLVPVLGFGPPPLEASLSSHLRGFVSHLVFGAALEAGMRAMEATPLLRTRGKRA